MNKAELIDIIWKRYLHTKRQVDAILTAYGFGKENSEATGYLEAVKCSELADVYVKFGEYETAIQYYTQAINSSYLLSITYEN